MSCTHAVRLGKPYDKHKGSQVYWADPVPVFGGIFAGSADGSTRARKIYCSQLNIDAVVADKENKRLYFTNMTLLNPNDGSVQRGDIVDGRLKNIADVVPKGWGLKTPKQLSLDKANNKVYVADREGRTIRSDFNCP